MRPPPVKWRPLLGWAVLTAVLGAAVVVEDLTRARGDDPVQARQRPGILIPAAEARLGAVVGDETPARGRRTVVFFIRDGGYDELVEALRGGAAADLADLDPPADIVVAVPRFPSESLIVTGIARDPDGAIAAAYGMPTPVDGGRPVGYAVVDTAQRVRYATLDPGMTRRLDEVVTMARATP